MLFVLGLLTTALYVPGLANASALPRWAAILAIVPWHIWPKRAILYAPVFVFLATAVALSPAPLDAVNQAFIVLAWLALFCLGTQVKSLTLFYLGAGIGLFASSIIAILQWFGAHPVEIMFPGVLPSGLFVNGHYMAEAAALIIVAAVSEFFLMWLVPLLLPALLLPQAKAAVLAAAVALAAYVYHRSRILTLGIIAGTVVGIVALSHYGSVSERLLIWQSTWSGLTWLGHGLGSFWSAYPAFDLRPDAASFPEYAHNEFLHLAFEFGALGVLGSIAFVAAVAGPLDTSRLVLIALFVEACFGFPLHLPSTAAIGFLAAGHAVRSGYILRYVRARGGVGGIARALARGRAALSIRAPLSRTTMVADRN